MSLRTTFIRSSLDKALLLETVLECRHHERHVGVRRVVTHDADAPYLAHGRPQPAGNLNAAICTYNRITTSERPGGATTAIRQGLVLPGALIISDRNGVSL